MINTKSGIYYTSKLYNSKEDHAMWLDRHNLDEGRDSIVLRHYGCLTEVVAIFYSTIDAKQYVNYMNNEEGVIQ